MKISMPKQLYSGTPLRPRRGLCTIWVPGPLGSLTIDFVLVGFRIEFSDLYKSKLADM